MPDTLEISKLDTTTHEPIITILSWYKDPEFIVPIETILVRFSDWLKKLTAKSM